MKAEFYFDHRRYICSLVQVDRAKELKIKNHQGLVLAVKQGQKVGLIGKTRQDARQVDVSQPYFYNLIKAAMSALALASKDEVILDKSRAIADAEKIIQQQTKEIGVLNEQMNMLIAQLELLSAQQKQLPMQLIENDIAESEICQEVEPPSPSLADLPLQLIEDKIRESEVSQECDRPLQPQELDNPKRETEVDLEIEESPSEMTEFSVQLIENRLLAEETQEEGEIVASKIAELPEYPVEFEVANKESEIKRLPKRASNRRMRKKS